MVELNWMHVNENLHCLYNQVCFLGTNSALYIDA